jgi:hypothetical protein
LFDYFRTMRKRCPEPADAAERAQRAGKRSKQSGEKGGEQTEQDKEKTCSLPECHRGTVPSGNSDLCLLHFAIERRMHRKAREAGAEAELICMLSSGARHECLRNTERLMIEEFNSPLPQLPGSP